VNNILSHARATTALTVRPAIQDVGAEAIGRNRLLAALPPAPFDLLAPHLLETTLEKGQVLEESGESITRVYFPHGGLISLLAILPEGHAIDTTTVGREGAIGLAAALCAQTAFTRAVVQLPAPAASISAARLAEVAAASKPVHDMIVRYSAMLLAQVQQLAACNTVHHVQERLCRWLAHARERMGGDTLPLTQEFLADVLGVQRTTVTMIARMLQAQGIIQVRRGRIHIRDIAALEHKACACHRIVRRLNDRMRHNGD
jgi:CRP-like cAMP-binding protein